MGFQGVPQAKEEESVFTIITLTLTRSENNEEIYSYQLIRSAYNDYSGPAVFPPFMKVVSFSFGLKLVERRRCNFIVILMALVVELVNCIAI